MVTCFAQRAKNFSKKCKLRKVAAMIALGCANVPKVQNNLVNVNFPIHMDPRTSPSEKISIFFEIYYEDKRVEVLPSKLLSSDFGQSECGSKNP